MAKFAELYDECEQLFVEGKTHSEIQAETGVSLTTQTQWKRKGEWETKRAEYIKQNQNLKEKLKKITNKLAQRILDKLEKDELDTQELYGLTRLVSVTGSKKLGGDTPDETKEKPDKEKGLSQNAAEILRGILTDGT